jgi:hypothetical protein
LFRAAAAAAAAADDDDAEATVETFGVEWWEVEGG